MSAAPPAALQPGRPWPLGATLVDGGVNVAVASEHASQIDLCLFDAEGRRELARLPLPAKTDDVWHGHLPGAGAGLVYGLRVHGPWRPDRGHRFNPNKLLLDPWAREIVEPPGGYDARDVAHYAADRQHPEHMDARDNAALALKARVPDDAFDWQGDARLLTPLAETVIYELHVKSFTRRMPDVPEHQRGTYAGLASDAAIAHLQRLGVTAVELLPVFHIVDEPRLRELGLKNHWGYNTAGFFCPDPRYASTRDARREFKAMVQRLHAAGIEVLLDVVFNHTPEGDERGPTIAWRGLDNLNWYRVPAERKAGYENWTGCGNTVDIRHPRALQLVLDSLRHWVGEMHVDGFRFDLAPILGRGAHDFDPEGAFFQAVLQDPLLQGAKLIAEPWDIGPQGYQVGRFPAGWLEWNDKFRDTARAFWLGGDCTRGEFALRLAGSSDLFQPRRRSPLASVNYIVSHDGFTLADLVSYDMRHNEANGEGGRDGHAHNLSWNCGWEGPTTDPDVLALRARLQRALLATVLLAQGTPMLAAGDELGHSQGGNNNPYCQDNATTWIDWTGADQALIDYTAQLLQLRRTLLPLAPRWYTGLPDARGVHDLAWLRRNGDTMTPEQWNNRGSRIIGAWIGVPGRPGPQLLLLANGRNVDSAFVLPAGRWRALLDSAEADGRSAWQGVGAFPLRSRSVALLQQLASPPMQPQQQATPTSTVPSPPR